jgi:hypothetical protein
LAFEASELRGRKNVFQLFDRLESDGHLREDEWIDR